MSLVINFLTGAPRTPTPLAVDPPARGSGRFGNLLSDLWEREGQAGEFLGEAGTSGADGLPATTDTVADVFNQHGILARDVNTVESEAAAVALGAVAASGVSMTPVRDVASDDLNPVTVAPTPIAIATPLQMVRADQTAAQIAPEPAGQILSPDVAIASAAATAPFAAASPHREVPLPSVCPASQVAARSLLITDFGSLEGTPEAQGRNPVSREMAERQATSNVQLRVHTDGQNAAIVGRAVDIGEPGRSRLRDRIAALLSRYGLRARDVRLNGALLASPADPRNEEL